MCSTQPISNSSFAKPPLYGWFLIFFVHFSIAISVTADGYRDIPYKVLRNEIANLEKLHQKGDSHVAQRFHEIVDEDPEFAFQLLWYASEKFSAIPAAERLKFLSKLLRQPDEFWHVDQFEDPRHNGYRHIAIGRIISEIHHVAPALKAKVDHLDIHEGDDRRKMAKIVDDWTTKIEHDTPNTTEETGSDGGAN